MNSERQENRPARGSPETFRALLFLGLLAAGIFAAWLGHRRLRPGTPAAERSTEAPNREVMRSASGPAGGAELRAASREPARTVGLVAIDRDPQGLPAPAGALRRWAFRRKIGGVVQELAVYDHAAATQAILDHYTEILRERGFRRIRSPSPPGAARRVSFRKGQTHVVISLRKHDKDAKLVRVRAVATRYAPP